MESARFSGLESQQIRKRNLEAYINSEEEASDGTFGKIISGSALVSIFAGLIGVYIYYGGDGLMQATAGQRAIQENAIQTPEPRETAGAAHVQDSSTPARPKFDGSSTASSRHVVRFDGAGI